VSAAISPSPYGTARTAAIGLFTSRQPIAVGRTAVASSPADFRWVEHRSGSLILNRGTQMYWIQPPGA
jgi:hypothetical protein